MANTWHVTTSEFNDSTENCLKYALDNCACGDTILCEWSLEDPNGETCLMGDYTRTITHTDAESDVYVYIEQTIQGQRLGWDSFKIYNNGEYNGVFAIGFLDYADGTGSAGGCGPCRNVAIVGMKVTETTRGSGYVPVVVSVDSEDSKWCYFDEINTSTSSPLRLMFFNGHVDKDNVWIIWQDFKQNSHRSFEPEPNNTLRNIAEVGQHPAEGGTGHDIHLFYGCLLHSVAGASFQRVAQGEAFENCEINGVDINDEAPEISNCQLCNCTFRGGYAGLKGCRLYQSKFYGVSGVDSECEDCLINECEFYNNKHTITDSGIIRSKFEGIEIGSDSWTFNSYQYCDFKDCSAGDSLALIGGDVKQCTFEDCKYDYTYIGRQFGGNVVVNGLHNVVVQTNGRMLADDYDNILVVNDSRDYTIEVFGPEEGGKNVLRVKELECTDSTAVVTFVNNAKNVYKVIPSTSDKYIQFEGFRNGLPPGEAVYGNIFHVCGW